MFCVLAQVYREQVRHLRSPTVEQLRHVPARDADGRELPVYRANPRTWLNHRVCGWRAT
jgi:hypothetical protein